MKGPLAREEDALRELVNLGSAQAASMLARLVGDVGVLVEVPRVVEVSLPQLIWLLGGRDLEAFSVTFALEGEVPGALWWVLPADAAATLGQRLLRRPGVTGPLSASADAALAEAANLVASAFCSSVGAMLGARMVPSTPQVARTTIGGMVGDKDAAHTAALAGFVSTNAPLFSGTLVVLLSAGAAAEALRRLGIGGLTE